MGTYGGVGTDGGLAKASSVPLHNSTSMTSSIASASGVGGGSGIMRAGLLRRMTHVTSDEPTTHNVSVEDCRVTQPLLQKQESPVINSLSILYIQLERHLIGASRPLSRALKLNGTFVRRPVGLMSKAFLIVCLMIDWIDLHHDNAFKTFVYIRP